MSSRYKKTSQGGGRKGPNWSRVFGIILCCVMAASAAGGFLVSYYGHSIFSLSNYIEDKDVMVVAEEELPTEEIVESVVMETDQETEQLQEKEEISTEELKKIQNSYKTADKTTNIVADEDVFSLLLVGVDRRDKSWNGNSDSMMLVTINFSDKRISVVSIMRDLYVNIPDVGYRKLNNAYAVGGGPLLTKTISEAFNIELTRYASVDYENMIEIVDALGGIDLEWTDAEVTVANGYMVDMCNTLGMNSDYYILPGGGTWHCNGVQAVAYARNRYVGNSDYARTERQRYVISQIVSKIKTMSAPELAAFVTKVLPLVTHNINEADIWKLLPRVPELLTYEYVQDRIPYDGLYDVIYVDSQDMLVPRWSETVQKLHNTMYGDGSASENADNNQEDRLTGNDQFSDDFATEILSGEKKKTGKKTENAAGTKTETQTGTKTETQTGTKTETQTERKTTP